MEYDALISVSTHNHAIQCRDYGTQVVVGATPAYKAHYVYDGTAAKTLLDALGVPTKERDNIWLERRVTDQYGKLSPLFIDREPRQLDYVLQNFDVLHLNPVITE